jgi:hypothetical protein
MGGESLAALSAHLDGLDRGEVPEDMRELVAAEAADLVREQWALAEESTEAAPMAAVARLWQRVIAVLPVDSLLRPECLACLSAVLHSKYERSGDLADLDASVTIARQAADTAAPDDESLPGFHYALATALVYLFQAAGRLADLDEAIAAYRRAAGALPADDPDGADFRSDLGNALRLRFEQTGDLADLDAAISAGRQAVTAFPDEGVYQCTFAAALLQRYQLDGNVAGLESAIAALRDAVRATEEDEPGLCATSQANLGYALKTHYLRTGTRSSLREAIAAGRRSVATAAGADESTRASCLSNLAGTLLVSHGITGDRAERDEAIRHLEAAVAATRDGHHSQGEYLAGLGGALRIRSREDGVLADLDRAVAVIRRAMAVTPDGHRNEPEYCGKLCSALSDRYMWTGSVSDAEEAEALARRVLRAVPDGHKDRGRFLSDAGHSIVIRCQATRRFDDLPEAIGLCRKALATLPAGNEDRLWALIYLDAALGARPGQTADGAGLGERIAILEEAVDCSGDGRADDGTSRLGLAAALQARYEKTGDAADLTTAIGLIREALGLVPGPIELADCRAALGGALRLRYERHHDAADLAEAVALSRQAAEAIPAGYANAGLVRSSLGAVLATRLSDPPAPDRPARDRPAPDSLAPDSLAPDSLAPDSPAPGRAAPGQPVHDRAGASLGAPPSPASRTRAELIAAVATRVERYKRGGRDAVLEPGAAGDARRLAELLAAEQGDDLNAWETVGFFFWMRLLALPDEAHDDREEAYASAVAGYLPVFLSGQDVPEGMRSAMPQAALDALSELAHQAAATLDSALIDRYALLGRRTVDLVPPDSPWRPAFQLLAGSALIMRFHRAGDPADLDAGLADMEGAIAGTPTGDHFYPVMLAAHGEALRVRFEYTANPADLDRAIDEGQRAAALMPPGQPERARCEAAVVGFGLLQRFQLYGGPDTGDLDAAVDVLTGAAGASQAVPDVQAACAAYLCDALRSRYEALGDPADLDRAIAHARAGAARVPAGHQVWVTCQYQLGTALSRVAERTGDRADFDVAVGTLTTAAGGIAPGHPFFALAMDALAHARLARFSQFGDRADLDAAIAVSRQGLAGLPAGHVQRAELAASQSSALLSRYDLTGDRADLDHGIELGRQSVAATSAVTGARVPLARTYRAVTARCLRTRFARSGELADLEEAIGLLRQAVADTPDGHLARAAMLSSLGTALLDLHRAGTGRPGLAEAIELSRQALAMIPGAHQGRPWFQTALGGAIHARFEMTRRLEDLDEITGLFREAATATPDEHPRKCQYLFNLGGALRNRFTLTGDKDAALQAAGVFRQAALTAGGQPSLRIQAARSAAALVASAELGTPDHELAATLLELAVLLLPETAYRQLSRADRQHRLGAFAFLASDAAAAVLAAGGPGAPARALGLLELGRAVLHGQALDTRTDLTELYASHPALARRFADLRDELEAGEHAEALAALAVAHGPLAAAAGSPPPPGSSGRSVRVGAPAASVTRDKHAAAAEFAALLAEIRGMPGFAGFLLPPETGELVRHAARGPIVVLNVSESRSDALIVTGRGVDQLPLPGLAFSAVTERIDAFDGALESLVSSHLRAERERAEDVLSQTLEWLWDAAAEPVLTHLGFTSPPAVEGDWPRLWWVPGGLLGLLPLHAAGYHRSAGGHRTVLDRVVSSYTPTLRALGYARQREGASPPASSLIVAMPATPDLPPLPGVTAEAALLRGILPSPAVLIAGEGAVSADGEPVPTKGEVLARLPEAGIAHFACHGLSIPDDPSRSFLALADHQLDPLTVASLAEVRLHRAQLAYLSACQTARNDARDLPDEAIHLAAAFQLAGYPHVIGTLWPVSDSAATGVAGTFYERLRAGQRGLDTRKSAEALHHAVRALRDTPVRWTGRDRAGRPSLWAPFLHTGA